MEVQNTTSKMQERKAEAAEFLIDTRRLPPEARWKIQGMLELLELQNAAVAKAAQAEASRAVG